MKYRVLQVTKLDRDCKQSINYVVQKRKWFKWVSIVDFSQHDKERAIALCSALRVRIKNKVIA